MEIQAKTLVYVAVGIFFYLFLTDTFRQPSFQTTVRKFFNSTMGNSTTHSVIDWLENKTNSIAGLVSVSSVTILNAFPVLTDSIKFLLKILNFLLIQELSSRA